MHANTHTHESLHTNTCMGVDIHTHTHTHTHTHIHIRVLYHCYSKMPYSDSLYLPETIYMVGVVEL